MKFVYVSVLSSLVLLITSCGRKSSDKGEGSRVASFTIADFQTKEGGPPWESLKLKMERIAPSPLVVDKDYLKSAFQGGALKDLEFKVEYGKYKISLTYKDKDGKVTYTECEEETKKEHVIEAPTYESPIEICPKGSDDPAGQTEIKPSSEVTIRPQLK